MKRDLAKELLPIIQAYAEGKTIQHKVGDEWCDLSDPNFAGFDTKLYRVKPEEKYNEIFKLKEMLEKAEIPFEWIEHDKVDKQGYQICYPEKGEKRVCSVIEHSFSYGYEKDLLEIQGLLTAEEEECDSVLGYLTADNVFQRIFTHCEKTKHKNCKCILLENPIYRPFKDCDELIETWKNMMNKVLGLNESFVKTDLCVTTIWVKHKVDGRKRMIVGFGDNFVEVGVKAKPVTLERLFEMYTFLDGSTCGVEE